MFIEAIALAMMMTIVAVVIGSVLHKTVLKVMGRFLFSGRVEPGGEFIKHRRGARASSRSSNAWRLSSRA
jgi:hypothetical protein